MGQEIFYCGGCKNLLRTRDLDKGEAVKIEDRIYCKSCALKTFGTLPKSPRPAALSETPRPRSHLPIETPRPRSGGHITTSHIPRVAPPTTRTPTTPTALILGGVAGFVAVGLLLALALSSRPPRTMARPEASPEVPPVVVDPVPVPVPPTPRSPAPPPAVDREARACRQFEELRAYAAARPEDFDGLLARTRAALLEADGTAVAADVRRFEQDVRARAALRDAAAQAAAEARVRAALAAERFAEALAEAKVDPLRAEALAALAKAWKAASEKILDARRRNQPDALKTLTARVEGWGVASVHEELGKLLAAPVEVELPPEVVAYRKRWSEPWALAQPFDYPAALKELERPVVPAARAEAAADLEALRLAAEVAREAPLVLQKWPKGQDLRLERWDDAGRHEVAGKLLRAGPHDVEIWTGDEAVTVAAAEITPAGWGDLFRARAAKKPSDAQAARLYALLEGDAEGARRHGADEPPASLAAVAARAAADLRSAPEVDARRAFAAAEREFRSGMRRLSSASAYAALLKAPTSFARRARPLLEERSADAQEVFVPGTDLLGSGQFALIDLLKGVPSQSMLADAAPGRGTDNFVQIEIPFPSGEAPLRVWAYVGACCLETLAFGVQAPELSGPNPKDPKETVLFDPGAPVALPTRPSAVLRAKHTHGGPKEPAKWVWVPVPLPKYATAGPRKIRLVSEHQGFSIAYLWLGAGRPGPPREADLKEFERARGSVDALRGPAVFQTGSLLREWWTDVPGWRLAEIVPGVGGYPDRPAGSAPATAFEGPVNWAENYVQRFRGFLVPPLSGDYTFSLISDDESELLLSSDEMPGRKRRIAAVVGVVHKAREWENPPASKSQPVSLKAGKRYYVELVHKEGGIDDHVSVGWTMPDGTQERPIPGPRLAPPGGAVVRAGGTVLWRAFNINGPAVTIDGRPWEGKGAPDLAVTGDGMENQGVALNPPADGPKAQMIRSSVWRRDGVSAVVQNVPNGRYQVYAWFWEDNNSQTFDILLNDRVMREKYASGSAGHWERLGPWPVDVAEGRLELRTSSGGDANLSGLEIWRVGR